MLLVFQTLLTEWLFLDVEVVLKVMLLIAVVGVGAVSLNLSNRLRVKYSSAVRTHLIAELIISPQISKC
jgi:hypothetical protein